LPNPQAGGPFSVSRPLTVYSIYSKLPSVSEGRSLHPQPEDESRRLHTPKNSLTLQSQPVAVSPSLVPRDQSTCYPKAAVLVR